MRPVVVIAASGALVLAVAARAAATPSDRACLIAWNAPANHASRARLLAQRPTTGLSLRAGVRYVDTVSKGSASTTTGGPACLLSVRRRAGLELVTGMWTGTGVRSWTFGRSFPSAHPPPANVRLLPDGRVTKISLR
jgi:hypothetical protein